MASVAEEQFLRPSEAFGGRVELVDGLDWNDGGLLFAEVLDAGMDEATEGHSIGGLAGGCLPDLLTVLFVPFHRAVIVAFPLRVVEKFIHRIRSWCKFRVLYAHNYKVTCRSHHDHP